MAGTLGFSPDLHAGLNWGSFGAFVTNPISWRPRRPAEKPAVIEFPGGVLIHSGLPNPGFRRGLKEFSRQWEQSPLPIVPSLMADRPEETREMVRALEGHENILAVELGFAPLLADDLVLLAVDMSIGELPIIVSLPMDQVLRLGPKVEALGAAAVSLSPPRGALKKENQLVSGRLFGPSLFPPALELVRCACKLGLAVIGSAGVASISEAEAMLAVGALAVEVDMRLWIPSAKEKSPVY
jgi:dihydroorotate dehydrogenase